MRDRAPPRKKGRKKLTNAIFFEEILLIIYKFLSQLLLNPSESMGVAVSVYVSEIVKEYERSFCIK